MLLDVICYRITYVFTAGGPTAAVGSMKPLITTFICEVHVSGQTVSEEALALKLHPLYQRNPFQIVFFPKKLLVPALPLVVSSVTQNK